MNKACVSLLLLLGITGGALFAQAKELSPQEEEKGRAMFVHQNHALNAWMADDIKDMSMELAPTLKATIFAWHRDIIKNLPDKLSVAPAKLHKILVITLTHPLGHHGDAQGAWLAILREMGRKTGAWDMTLVYSEDKDHDLNQMTAETLKAYDAVVINNNFPLPQFFDQMQQGDAGKMAIQKFAGELLPAYVKAGGGLFIYHWGDIGSVPNYVQMIGCSFGGHPPAEASIFPVKVTDEKNPLMAAFISEQKPLPRGKAMVHVPKEFVDELYCYGQVQPEKDPTLRILLELDMEEVAARKLNVGREKRVPEIWVKHYGEGRIFYSQFGHSKEILKVPAIVQGMLDGMQYVLGDLPADDAPIPDKDVPSKGDK